MNRLIFLLPALLSLYGCSIFTRPLDKPVIEEKLNASWGSSASVGTLSLTPERRVVLVNFRNNRFCAEAPTEVGIDVASFRKLRAELSEGGKGNAGTEYQDSSNNHNTVLNKRTQGLQLFLANSYFACQMYLNGGIDERQALEMQFQTLKIVEPLINAELQYMHSSDAGKNVKRLELSAAEAEDEAKKAADAVLDEESARPTEAPAPAE